MNLLLLNGIQEILIVFIILLTAIIISKRNLISLINIFSFQSLLLSLLIFFIYIHEHGSVLLIISILTFVSKCIFIPTVLKKTTRLMNIYVDLEYNLFTPIASIFTSLILFGAAFFSIFSIKEQLQLDSLDYISAATGISLLLVGMLIIIGRKKIITKIIGYLVMENGILLMSIFIGELPFLIEVLILMDLLMLIAISAILGFGMDSSVEEFHAKLNPFRKWFKKVSK